MLPVHASLDGSFSCTQTQTPPQSGRVVFKCAQARRHSFSYYSLGFSFGDVLVPENLTCSVPLSGGVRSMPGSWFHPQALVRRRSLRSWFCSGKLWMLHLECKGCDNPGAVWWVSPSIYFPCWNFSFDLPQWACLCLVCMWVSMFGFRLLRCSLSCFKQLHFVHQPGYFLTNTSLSLNAYLEGSCLGFRSI